MTDSVVPLPEVGQLAEVRQRRWIVIDVAASTLPQSLFEPASNGHPHHLVGLSSVEDDGLGEELQVIWEIEPGARVLERVALPEPTGFDEPRRLDAFLDAVRWGATSTADVKALQAPFRSGIEIEDYQLDPVVRAIQMPRVNLLIADDVGLGKTIEAGLVIQELIVRHRARRVLVVCPASLQIKWQTEMREKFGLDFRIVDADRFKDGRKRLHRATARLIPDAALDTPAMVAHARLVVVGSDSQRLHEEVLTTAAACAKDGLPA
jgi:SNF2-related domain